MISSNNSMIAEIIPFIRLPRTMEAFDYIIPKNLEVGLSAGSIVSVPFRRKNILGFTVKLKNTSYVPANKLRAINKVIVEKSLTDEQIDLFYWMAENYATARSIIIKMFFPFTSKSFFNKLSDSKRMIQDSRYKIQDTKHPWLKNQSLLVQYDNRETVLKEYEKIAAEFAKSKKQLLILFPRLVLLRRFYDSLHDKIKKHTEIYQSTGIKQSALQNAFWRIKNNEAKIILGTRPALFAPFANLSAIIIDHEESPDHRQEEPNPRYHPIDAAEFLQKRDKRIKILYASPLPSIDRFSAVLDKKIKFISGDNFNQSEDQIKILDTRHPESWRTTYPFHFEMEAAIKDMLENGKSVFILAGRRGESAMLVCADCGWSPACPNCAIPLSIVNERKIDEALVCIRCGLKQAGTPFCPSCQGTRLKYRGAGIKKIYEAAIKLFPDAQIRQIAKEPQTNINKSDSHPEIIIGTPYAIDYIDYFNIGLIGMVSTDGALFSSQFRSAERFGQLLCDLMSLAPKADLLVQTMAPEHKVFTIWQRNRADFLHQELESRKAANYPPFSAVLKIIIQNKKYETAESSANAWIEKNNDMAGETGIEILGPIRPSNPLVHGRFRTHIILRTKENGAFSKIIKQIPNDWIIDKNPENLL